MQGYPTDQLLSNACLGVNILLCFNIRSGKYVDGGILKQVDSIAVITYIYLHLKPVPRLESRCLSNATDPIQNWAVSKSEQYSSFKFKCGHSCQYSVSFVPMSRRSRGSNTWEVRASTLARNTHNLIRDIVENLQVEPNPAKQLIALSVG